MAETYWTEWITMEQFRELRECKCKIPCIVYCNLKLAELKNELKK